MSAAVTTARTSESPAPTPPVPAAGGRLAWADVAKGACILLVVLHHVTMKHYLPMVPSGLAGAAAAWEWLTYALKPVRMPLFFLLAGVFAAGAVRRPWPQVLTRRVLTPYWLYVVWLVVIGAVFTVEQTMATNRVHDVGELATDLVFASTSAWFLYALAVYFVVTKLTVRLDAAAAVAGAALLALSVSGLPMSAANRESVLLHLVYFVLGARLPEVAHRLGAWRAPWVALVPAYVAAVVGLDALGTPLSLEVALLSLLGVPLAVRLAVAAEARRGPWSAGLAMLGRRTLPVYVLHMPVLALLHHVPGLGLGLPGVAGGVAVVLYPVLATALVVVVSWWLHRLLLAVGLGALFALPTWLTPSERALRAAAGFTGARVKLALPARCNPREVPVSPGTR